MYIKQYTYGGIGDDVDTEEEEEMVVVVLEMRRLVPSIISHSPSQYRRHLPPLSARHIPTKASCSPTPTPNRQQAAAASATQHHARQLHNVSNAHCQNE